jgi:hypothetical protein
MAKLKKRIGDCCEEYDGGCSCIRKCRSDGSLNKVNNVDAEGGTSSDGHDMGTDGHESDI